FVAQFEPIPVVTFEIEVISGAGGSVSGSGTYSEFDNATISATPSIGYIFSHWEEDGQEISSDPNYEFMVTGDRSFTAIFDTFVPVPTPSVIRVKGRFRIV